MSPTSAVADHGRAVVDHWRMVADHWRMVADHWRMVVDHGRMVVDHGRVIADHGRMVVDHFGRWERKADFVRRPGGARGQLSLGGSPDPSAMGSVAS